VDINPAGNAVMRVEITPTVASVRKSIRITTKQSFTGGLVIMDSVHMPTGCATWREFCEILHPKYTQSVLSRILVQW
jgi:hypothetical protein